MIPKQSSFAGDANKKVGEIKREFVAFKENVIQ
jgi:hypothetical protein